MGVNNLWELLSVVRGLDDSLLSPAYKNGIMHHRHITKYRAVSGYHGNVTTTPTHTHTHIQQKLTNSQSDAYFCNFLTSSVRDPRVNAL